MDCFEFIICGNLRLKFNVLVVGGKKRGDHHGMWDSEGGLKGLDFLLHMKKGCLKWVGQIKDVAAVISNNCYLYLLEKKCLWLTGLN